VDSLHPLPNRHVQMKFLVKNYRLTVGNELFGGLKLKIRPIAHVCYGSSDKYDDLTFGRLLIRW